MNVSDLRVLIDDGKTIRQIADECNMSMTTIRYWLHKFGLRTKRGPHGYVNKTLRKEMSQNRKCGCCGTTDVSKFYGRRRDYCRECFNRKKLEVGRKRREWAIAHLGGRCVVCGFNKWSSGLDLHHLDPKKKDVGFRGFRYWSLKRCEDEIKKCVLVCKNCHAGIHSGNVELRGVAQSGQVRQSGGLKIVGSNPAFPTKEEDV